MNMFEELFAQAPKFKPEVDGELKLKGETYRVKIKAFSESYNPENEIYMIPADVTLEIFTQRRKGLLRGVELKHEFTVTVRTNLTYSPDHLWDELVSAIINSPKASKLSYLERLDMVPPRKEFEEFLKELLTPYVARERWFRRLIELEVLHQEELSQDIGFRALPQQGLFSDRFRYNLNLGGGVGVTGSPEDILEFCSLFMIIDLARGEREIHPYEMSYPDGKRNYKTLEELTGGIDFTQYFNYETTMYKLLELVRGYQEEKGKELFEKFEDERIDYMMGIHPMVIFPMVKGAVYSYVKEDELTDVDGKPFPEGQLVLIITYEYGNERALTNLRWNVEQLLIFANSEHASNYKGSYENFKRRYFSST